MKKIVVSLACLLAVGAQAQNYGTVASRKLNMAEFYINNLYVDKVNENKLVEEAIVKMLSTLDPHSTYANPEEVKKLNEPLQGNFEGIGVQFNMSEDTLLVIQPVSGGPSEKIGILAGDRIIAVNDTAIAGVKMNTDEVMRRLKGPKGTTVNLKVLRRGVPDLLNFTVKRDRIPLYSLDASYIIKDKIGYIRISRFASTTADEFIKALKDLKSRGMKDLILDLQDNGGGFLNAAIDLANEFLGQKELIVYTEGNRSPRSEFFAKGNGRFQDGRLVVLVNEFSASASEILSGAIQDWDRGLIVGRRSFGKGLVQRPVDLPDGSMIRLTVARYYTPAGRCIQKPYESIEKYNMDLINRYNKGEMMNSDSIHFPDSLKCKTKKFERIVYGGGGIMPDYFVPVDTTLYTDYHRNLVAKGSILKVTLKYVENHRKELLGKYKKFSDFKDKFEVDDALMDELVEAGKAAKVELNKEQLKISEPLIRTQLKAMIARDLWDMGEYYQVMNAANPTILKAVDILQSGDYERKLNK